MLRCFDRCCLLHPKRTLLWVLPILCASRWVSALAVARVCLFQWLSCQTGSFLHLPTCAHCYFHHPCRYQVDKIVKMANVARDIQEKEDYHWLSLIIHVHFEQAHHDHDLRLSRIPGHVHDLRLLCCCWAEEKQPRKKTRPPRWTRSQA